MLGKLHQLFATYAYGTVRIHRSSNATYFLFHPPLFPIKYAYNILLANGEKVYAMLTSQADEQWIERRVLIYYKLLFIQCSTLLTDIG